MGLMDKLKKKKPEFREKSDTEIIGGLLADNPPPLSDLIDDESYPALPGPGDALAQGFGGDTEGVEKARPSDDLLSSMDIFTQETAATDDGFNLASKLPDINLAELLVECRDVVARLREKKDAEA